MAIDYRDGVSILLLVFYIPAHVIAIFLAIRHGFSKSYGWIFMIVFTLARILSACFQLATINKSKDISLYIAYSVLIGIAVSPLELVAFGLLNRIRASINRNFQTLITPRHFRLAELLNVVGMTLSIIGGVKSGNNYSKTGQYVPQDLSKVGLALFIVSFLAILATTVILSPSISHAEPGERRVLLAVAVSLPFLFVRLVYSSAFTFGNHSSFSPLRGNVTVLLCMALLEEIAIVLVYECVGLTLRKVTKRDVATGYTRPLYQRNNAENHYGQELGRI